jgi:hypothetical protein
MSQGAQRPIFSMASMAIPGGAKNKDEIDQHFWPAWLKAEVKDVSVHSVGYCAHILKLEGSSPHFFREIFDRLLETPELQDGPLFLVGHSLGGLVIKQLIRTAEGDAFVRGEAKQFLERIEKIVFLATPHQGADLTGWTKLVNPSARQSLTVSDLCPGNPHFVICTVQLGQQPGDMPSYYV